MREIRQSGSEGGGAPWRSLPLLALSRLRRFRMARGPETRRRFGMARRPERLLVSS